MKRGIHAGTVDIDRFENVEYGVHVVASFARPDDDIKILATSGDVIEDREEKFGTVFQLTRKASENVGFKLFTPAESFQMLQSTVLAEESPVDSDPFKNSCVADIVAAFFAFDPLVFLGLAKPLFKQTEGGTGSAARNQSTGLVADSLIGGPRPPLESPS